MQAIQPFIMPNQNVGLEILKYANERGDQAYARAYQAQKDKYLVSVEKYKQKHEADLLEHMNNQMNLQFANSDVDRQNKILTNKSLEMVNKWNQDWISAHPDEMVRPTSGLMAIAQRGAVDQDGKNVIERYRTQLGQPQPSQIARTPVVGNLPEVTKLPKGYSTKSVQSTTTPVEDKTAGIDNAITDGNEIKTRATVFGLNPDGSVDKEDNGKGWLGANTRDPSLVGVSIPIQDVVGMYGSLDAARKHIAKNGAPMFNVTNPKTGAKIQAPLVDVGPSRSQVAKGVGLDLTYGASKALGGTGLDQMQYSLASNSPLGNINYTDSSIPTSALVPNTPESYQYGPNVDYSEMVNDTLKQSLT